MPLHLPYDESKLHRRDAEGNRTLSDALVYWQNRVHRCELKAREWGEEFERLKGAYPGDYDLTEEQIERGRAAARQKRNHWQASKEAAEIRLGELRAQALHAWD